MSRMGGQLLDRGAVYSKIRSNLRTTSHANGSIRHLHAAWSILLDHHWLLNEHEGKTLNIMESDEPSDIADTRTILFLHDAFADRNMSTAFATSILQTAQNAPIQCLLVDTR